jgi:HEAT repeat protein/energy-coupling factor transporter ATP-binding protein EcfA2
MSLDFQSYLKKSIEDASRKQQSFYVSTDAVERPQLRLMAQKVPEKQQDGQPEEKVNPVPVLEGIRDFYAVHKHVVLVGRPGSGKSTTLNQLLIEEATRSIENPSLPIPVLVPLKSDQPILKLIQRALWRGRLRLDETAIEDLLFEGRLLLLLDGINEIPRQELQQELQEFREDNLNVSMIFTTRDLASGGYLGIEKQLEMQPLTPSQLREFVGESFPEQTEEFLNQLSDRLKKLGETPLLLEMLCEVFRETGEIPDNLGLVFREFMRRYERNLKEGVRIESDRELWKPVLQQLAWVMMQGEKPTEFRVAIRFEEAVGAIAQFLEEKEPYAEDFTRRCLRDLQKHHLIQVGTNPEELEFRHQLIQEYYAAEALLSRLEKFGIENGELFEREFLNFLKWTEPISLMLVLLDEVPAIRVVETALEVDWMLGARLAGQVKQEYQDKTLSLVTALNISKTLKIKLLDEMRSEITIEELRTALKDEETLYLALEALGRIGSDKAICKISQVIDGKSSAQSLAIRILERIRSRGAIAELQEIALNADIEIKREIDRALERLGVKSTVIPPSRYRKRRLVRTVPQDSERKLLLPIQQITYPSIHELIWNSYFEEPEYFEKLESFVEMLKEQDHETVTTILLTKSDQADFQEPAALVLGFLGCERVVPQLIHALESEEESIRKLAVLALSKIGTPDAIDGVIQALEDEDVFELAAEVLIQLSDELALPGLLQLLQKEYLDTDLYTRVAKAVLEIGSEDAVEGLIQALQHENFDIAWTVADVLKAAGKESLAFRELYEAMKNGDYYERYQTAIILGYLGEIRAIPMLIIAIDCDDPDLCWKAIYVLRKFSDHPIAMSVFELAAPSLIELVLKNRFGDAKIEAIEVLGNLGNPQRLPEFWRLSFSSLAFLDVIKAIQKKWKFYSYEIAQAYVEAQKADRQTPQNSDLSNITYDLRGATISNLAHEVQGNQITQPEEPQ